MTVETRPVLHPATELAIARPLSPIEATVICGELAERDIPVDVEFEIDGWVHLWPTEPCGTAAEVLALREFALVTDQRLAWHDYQEVPG